MSWINDIGPLGDVVLSSRIRLARNLADIPFPQAMDKIDRDSVIHGVYRSIAGSDSPIGEEFQFLSMKDLSHVDRQILVEKHLASPDLMKYHERSAILVNWQEECSIMINEEDHIRLQCILPGYQLKRGLDYLNNIDDIIEAQLPYAFDPNLGYLTSCPTNLGTGMRASIMLHLPILATTGQMKAMLQTLAKIGVTVRGLYGEGSEVMGDIYQISNQITLGASEEEIISNLEIVAKQIVQKEKQARQLALAESRIHLEDEIWRAYGTMLHARCMDFNEFMELLSTLRLGVETGIMTKIDIKTINRLMIMGQPGHLRKYGDKTIGDLDIIRAEVISKLLRSTELEN